MTILPGKLNQLKEAHYTIEISSCCFPAITNFPLSQEQHGFNQRWTGGNCLERSRSPKKPLGMTNVEEISIYADLWLTSQYNLPVTSAWVCSFATAFIQSIEAVLQHAKKATIIQPVFISLFSLSER